MAHRQTAVQDESECQPSLTSAHTAAKPKARQVTARYLQPKPPAAPGVHAASNNGPLTGRASLAGFGSAGWAELQHPNHAATPFMASGGSVGSSTAAKGSRARGGVPLPTPAAGPRQALQRQAQEQQFMTPAPAAAPMMGPSTTSRSLQASSAASAAPHSRQQVMQMPRGLSMSAAISSRSAAAGDRPGMFSADLTGTVSAQQQAGTGDMRAKLSAWREMKQQQRTAVKPGAFKEPAPKSTLFRATAATRVNKEPSTGSRKPIAGSSTGARAAAGDKGSSSSSSAPAAFAAVAAAAGTVTSPAASSAAESTGAATAASSASPSAFSATMATLQHSGGKAKPRKSSSSSKAGGSRPSPVPLLPLAQAGLGNLSGLSSPALLGQQQLQHTQPQASHMVGSSTKIPKLNLSSLSGTPQLQRQPSSRGGQAAAPLSSRWPSSSGGEAVLPDATPRSVRDAPPSRVPRTPRTVTPAASRQQYAHRSSTPDGNDRGARQQDTSKSAAEQQQHGSSTPASSKPAVPKLKLGAMLAGVQHPEADAAGQLNTRPAAAAAGHSCLSARGPAAAARGSAGMPPLPHGTPTARNRVSSDGGAPAVLTPLSARGRTSRGAAVPAAAGRMPTPRSLASSMSAVAGPVAGGAKKAEADTADEVRQQLRLLRMQQLQLRHLNARMAAALQSKKEKMEASVAAAAAAVVDLSGQLLKAKHQAQQSGWQSQLKEVLQQQHCKLQAWGKAQAQHQANISQLQAACSSALSHVPLLNGATVGHNPEQPDLQALQRQLQQGMQLLGELRPAMQQLMTGECPSSSSSAAAAARSSRSSIHSSAADLHLHPKGIRDTAALARDLMTVADEECRLLQQLTQQLAELSDLQLYVNSMQVQLQLMNQPGMEDVF